MVGLFFVYHTLHTLFHTTRTVKNYYILFLYFIDFCEKVRLCRVSGIERTIEDRKIWGFVPGHYTSMKLKYDQIYLERI